MPILMEKEEEGMLSPILAHGGVRFMWIKHNNLYLVATSKKNACVSLVFSFLYKVVQVFSEYFKELEEESIRDNFVIIYELLDELMDFGYPQTTDSKILQEYITQEGHKLETGAPRPPPPSPMQCPGGRRASSTGRTRSSWMSLSPSTSW